MNANVTSIRKDHGDEQPGQSDRRDPLRAELASAIKTAWKATCAKTDAATSVETARRAVENAELELTQNQERIAKAKSHDAKVAANAISEGAVIVAPAGATRKARMAVAESEDAVEVAKSAHARLIEDLATAEVALAWRQNAMIVARNNLLRPAAEEILERARSARRVLTIAERYLLLMLQQGDEEAPKFADSLESMRAQEARDAPLAAIRDAAKHFFTAGKTTDEEQAAGDATTAAMREAMRQLIEDSATEIPTLP